MCVYIYSICASLSRARLKVYTLFILMIFDERKEREKRLNFFKLNWSKQKNSKRAAPVVVLGENNFQQLSDRLIVPPVVRTLIYAQNPKRVKEWVDLVSSRWHFEQIIPAHFEAPIKATPSDLRRAFKFLGDDSIDGFPEEDLARGLKPIADIALGRLGSTSTVIVR